MSWASRSTVNPITGKKGGTEHKQYFLHSWRYCRSDFRRRLFGTEVAPERLILDRAWKNRNVRAEPERDFIFADSQTAVEEDYGHDFHK